MQVFRELFIMGSSEHLAATVAEVERSLTGGWTRDRAEEERMRPLATRGQPTCCFSRAKEEGRPAATVFLTEKKPGTWYASNVIPRSKHQLSYDEYNDILGEFCDRFVRPAADRTGARVDLTTTRADLEHWLPTAAAEKLRAFAATANKSTGAAHPRDRERWNDFVMAAHEGRGRLDSSTLRRWLIEIEGWPVEVADQLAGEFEFGQELLAFADGRRSA